MGESVKMDEKGRLVLPKKVRDKARIGPNARLVARASEVGRVELYDLSFLVAQAQGIGARKLAGWKEEDQEADALALELTKRKHETR